MNIYRSKLEFKQYRYPKTRVKCVNLLPEAIRSNHWNFNYFSVLETRHPDLSKDTKISSIKVWADIQICGQSQNQKKTKMLMSALTRCPLKGSWASRSVASFIYTPKPNSERKEKMIQGSFWAFSKQILSLFLSKFSRKRIQKPFISLFPRQ